MRLIVIGLTLALAASAPLAATAQAPVTTQPLARGEVLLELNGAGSVVTRADLAVLNILASGDGATVEEASAAARREAQRIAGIIRAAAGEGATVEIAEPQSVPAYEAMAADMNATMVDDTNAMAAEMPPSRMMANVTVLVRLRDVSRVAPMMEALNRAGVSLPALPVYALADPTVAQREARRRALAAARSSADAYASALGLRVVRVVRVTERLGFDFFTMMMSEQRMRRQFEENHSPDVETSVTLGVDFALAPQ